MPDTKISALTTLTGANLAAGDLMVVVDVSDVTMAASGTNKDIVSSDLLPALRRIAGDQDKVVGTDQANSTVTAAAVTDLSATVGAGTYTFKYWICYRSAATSTGIQMYVRHAGTTTRCVSTWYTLTTGGAAATGIADQATTTTAQMMEGKGQRASDVANGAMAGVDTASADQFAVLEGIMVVTVSGVFDLMFNSEVAASAVTIMTGTSLVLSKVA